MEIVYRALAIFFFLWLVTRVVGRTTLGELSALELLLYITMGDLVQQAVTQQDYSVTGGILAISVFALLTIVASLLARRWPQARPVVHGAPYVVVRDGIPVEEAMKLERLAMDDLLLNARQQGITHFSHIHLAVMETNGEISFFTRHASSDGATPPEQKG